jgi:hypothetical protein
MDIPDEKAVVQLSGEDGNGFFIIGRAMSAMKKAGYSKETITAYQEEAMSGDYDHLLQVTMKYCVVH